GGSRNSQMSLLEAAELFFWRDGSLHGELGLLQGITRVETGTCLAHTTNLPFPPQNEPLVLHDLFLATLGCLLRLARPGGGARARERGNDQCTAADRHGSRRERLPAGPGRVDRPEDESRRSRR